MRPRRSDDHVRFLLIPAKLRLGSGSTHKGKFSSIRQYFLCATACRFVWGRGSRRLCGRDLRPPLWPDGDHRAEGSVGALRRWLDHLRNGLDDRRPSTCASQVVVGAPFLQPRQTCTRASSLRNGFPRTGSCVMPRPAARNEAARIKRQWWAFLIAQSALGIAGVALVFVGSFLLGGIAFLSAAIVRIAWESWRRKRQNRFDAVAGGHD